MNIYKLIGRNLEITDAIRDYVEKKLARLDRYQDGELMAKVVLSLAGGRPGVVPVGSDAGPLPHRPAVSASAW